MSIPACAIDDLAATNVTDGVVEVDSGAHWGLFTPRHLAVAGTRASPSSLASDPG
jgi:hypothetical protein